MQALGPKSIPIPTAETAGSMWLIKHSWTCTRTTCPIPNCAVMKKIVTHCVSCKLQVGTCVNACNRAHSILSHYNDCGKLGGDKMRKCLVCARLSELEIHAQGHLRKKKDINNIITTTPTTPHAAPLRPNPTQNKDELSSYQKRFKQVSSRLVSEEMEKNQNLGTPLRPLSVIQDQANRIVRTEQTFRDNVYSNWNNMLTTPPPLLRPNSLPSTTTKMRKKGKQKQTK